MELPGMLAAGRGDKAQGCPTRGQQVQPQARWDAAAPVIALTEQTAALEPMGGPALAVGDRGTRVLCAPRGCTHSGHTCLSAVKSSVSSHRDSTTGSGLPSRILQLLQL